jgi:enoyl-CoA hydratase
MITLTHGDGIATLSLSRPPVNAVSDEFITLFDATLDELAAQSDWKVLHVRSDQKVFCAGADLVQVRERFEAPDGPDRTYRFVAKLQRLYQRLEQLPQVTLAEIGGAAMGGGLELALACDLRIVALEAKLGLPEARLGLIPAPAARSA